MEECQAHPGKVVAVLLSSLPHRLEDIPELRILFFTDRYAQNQHFRIGEAPEGSGMGGLHHKAAPKRIVGIPAAEGVHFLQILGQADGGMVVLGARERLEDAGQQRPCLADYDIQLFVTGVHMDILSLFCDAGDARGMKRMPRFRREPSCVVYCAASSTAMTVPFSELSSTQTEPPWRLAISQTSESPSPAPPYSRLRDLSTRKKGWKMLC